MMPGQATFQFGDPLDEKRQHEDLRMALNPPGCPMVRRISIPDHSTGWRQWPAERARKGLGHRRATKSESPLDFQTSRQTNGYRRGPSFSPDGSVTSSPQTREMD